MLMTRSVISIFSAVMMVLGASAACAQGYPTKPIRIVTASPGGGADRVARKISDWISGPLGGQSIIIENHGGVTRSIDIVARALPDGYTLLVAGSTLWTLPLLTSEPLWDPVKDFSPITFATTTPSILVVTPSLPVKSVKDLIALAKAKPGVLNYSASVVGSASHLGVEKFKSMAGVNIVGVNYKGNGPAAVAVASGDVQMTIGGTSTVNAWQAGKVRALAISSAQRSPLFPELPTVSESGVPGFEASAVNVVMAPARTPAAIITRLNQEIVRFLSDPAVKRGFLDDGGQLVVPTTPEEFAAIIKSEMVILSKVIKDAGIKTQ